MAGTRFWAAIMLAGLAACSPEDQTPFELDPMAEVTKKVGASGGTISTPAGLSLNIPEGALGTNADIKVKPVAGTGLGTGINGSVVPGTAFEFTPMGLALSKPAKIELSAGGRSGNGQATLIPISNGGMLQNRLSLAESSGPADHLGYFVIVDTGSGILIIPEINLDIDRKIISTWIQTLGLVGIGYTNPLTLRPSAQYNATGGMVRAGNYEIRCGIRETACVGAAGSSPIGIYTDASVISRYPKLGAIITSAHGTLSFNTLTGTVTGSAEINGVIQAVVGGTVTSKAVTVTVTSGQGGTILDPKGVPYRTSGNQISFETSDGWKSFEYSATTDYLEFSLSETTIPLTDENGVEQDYPISLVIRLQKSTGN